MKKKSTLVLLVLVILNLAFLFLSINLGYSKIPVPEILSVLFRNASGGNRFVIMQIRLPRILLAMLCGAGLALSGGIFQTVSDNPLADPGILGINSGAGVMMMVYLSLPLLHTHSVFLQPLFALAGGLLACVLLYLFSRRKGRIVPRLFLLGGIGLSAGASAIMTIIGANLETNIYQIVTRWMSGNIWGAGWQQLYMGLPFLLIFSPVLLLQSHKMDVLTLGDNTAAGLGVDTDRSKKLLLFFATVLAAGCVSVSGGMNFVGLVSPHIARRLTGVRHCRFLPASMLTGSLFLMLADTLGRSVFSEIEIPAGIVISVLAGPYFLYLLTKEI